jgi:hypothetical protein
MERFSSHIFFKDKGITHPDDTYMSGIILKSYYRHLKWN